MTLWGSALVEALKDGNVTIKPTGNSMTPIIQSGQEVELEPVMDGEKLSKGDVVFCRVHGIYKLHKVSAFQGKRYVIANNHGFVNGITTRENIFGRMVRV